MYSFVKLCTVLEQICESCLMCACVGGIGLQVRICAGQPLSNCAFCFVHVATCTLGGRSHISMHTLDAVHCLAMYALVKLVHHHQLLQHTECIVLYHTGLLDLWQAQAAQSDTPGPQL